MKILLQRPASPCPPRHRLWGGGVILLSALFLLFLTVKASQEHRPTRIHPPAFRIPLTIQTQSGMHRFQVEVAADEESRARGLMHRESLPEDGGMIFLFSPPREIAMWMKDTPLSLDMLFVDPQGKIRRIHTHAAPGSLTPVYSGGDVAAVVELAAGVAEKIGAQTGNSVFYTLPETMRMEKENP